MPLFIDSYDEAEIGRKTVHAEFTFNRLASIPTELVHKIISIPPNSNINNGSGVESPRRALLRTPLFASETVSKLGSTDITERPETSSFGEPQQESEKETLHPERSESPPQSFKAVSAEDSTAGSEASNDGLIEFKAQSRDTAPSDERTYLRNADDEILVQKEPPLVYEAMTSVQSIKQKTEEAVVAEPPLICETERAVQSTGKEAEESSNAKPADPVPPEENTNLGKSEDDILVQKEVVLNQATAESTLDVTETTNIQPSPAEKKEEPSEAGPGQPVSETLEGTQDASLTAGAGTPDALHVIDEVPPSDSKSTGAALRHQASPIEEIRKLKNDFQNIKNVTCVLQRLLSSVTEKDPATGMADDLEKIHDLAKALPHMQTQLEASIEQYRSYIEQKKAANEQPAFTVEHMLKEFTDALNELQKVQNDYVELTQKEDPIAQPAKKPFKHRQDRV
uniref:Syntaxin N-terminal domain-containing protein n=1 Tax=Schistocephalus solidus TaxID=70667 RepID=A0A0X3NVW8_SCHSO